MKELLTGKCKEDFEYWYENRLENTQNIRAWYKEEHYLYDTDFYSLNFSFQYGVYLEFFDSVGIDIKCDYWINFNHIDNNKRYYRSWVNDDKASKQFTETRQEAQEQAIIKANKIYNERQ